ncbi:hypothetical protein SAMN05192560_0762 [Methylobacillus rhizosphaerae]|uniref:Uncharacterized protein n=1 Tax=Methylobacillus rhizosphaerae TaxID=551994 RepID=A0A238YS65_9PROT|nr:hypothetical protein [Methylobacillus rhizosphaerae]SNR73531.1 hypothetical protein SAMN05192560_0762 [Methylobacillus rhizosphaerae]
MTEKGLSLPLSEKELAIVQAYADMNGFTVDEAASKLLSEAIAKRVRKNTGKGRAKVYPIRREREIK